VSAIKRRIPDILIVDIMLSEGSFAGTKFVTEIRRDSQYELPVIFLSSRSDFQARLEAVRAGGDAYYIKPVDTIQLVDRLDGLTKYQRADPYRILIVDDDVTLAEHYGLILSASDMAVTIVNEPEKVMNALAESKPELTLMDVYMPICSGLELTKVIRQQDDYLSIPIVFLSSEKNLENNIAHYGWVVMTLLLNR